MSARLDTAVIIGVGLLGGSLGLALKARGLVRHVIGVGHRPTTLDTARRVGAIDEASLDAATAVQGADLIVVCTPAAMVIPMLDLVRPSCGARTLVTDVASTKAAICAHAAATWPRPLRFVGSHPMAGSEQFGPEYARTDLFEGSVCLVEDSPHLDPDAQSRTCELWHSVGARVTGIEPVRHDQLLACTSHIPHILSSALATLVARNGDVRDLVGGGYRDMTRIAAGRPSIWRDICLTNRDAIARALREFQEDLVRLHGALENADAEAIERFFEDGRAARQRTVEE